MGVDCGVFGVGWVCYGPGGALFVDDQHTSWSSCAFDHTSLHTYLLMQHTSPTPPRSSSSPTRELETRVEGYEKAQEEYRDTLSCINRLWTSLNDDIVLLIQRTVDEGDAAATPAQTTTSRPSATNGAMDTTDDPFLHALLHPNSTATTPHITKLINDATNHQRAASDAYSDVETALRNRMATTNAAMVQLLSMLTAERDKLRAAAAGGGDGGEGVEDAQQRVDVLQRQVDAQQGLARAVNNHIKLLQDELDKDKLTIRQLQSDLADKTEALLVVKRKLEHYRGAGAAGGVVNSTAAAADIMVDGAAAADGAVAGAAAGMLKESGPTESGELPGSATAAEALTNSVQYQQLERDHAALLAEVEELRQVLDQRAAKAEQAAQEAVKLKRELENCREVLRLESNVLSSKQYVALQAKHERVGGELMQARQALDMVRHEVAQERGLREAAEAKVCVVGGGWGEAAEAISQEVCVWGGGRGMSGGMCMLGTCWFSVVTVDCVFCLCMCVFCLQAMQINTQYLTHTIYTLHTLSTHIGTCTSQQHCRQ